MNDSIADAKQAKKLKKYGIVEQSKNGVSVPFQKIHTDFTLSQN